MNISIIRSLRTLAIITLLFLPTSVNAALIDYSTTSPINGYGAVTKRWYTAQSRLDNPGSIDTTVNCSFPSYNYINYWTRYRNGIVTNQMVDGNNTLTTTAYDRTFGSLRAANLNYDGTPASAGKKWTDIWKEQGFNSGNEAYIGIGVDSEGVTYVNKRLNLLNSKYVIDENNKTIKILLVSSANFWRGSGGDWRIVSKAPAFAGQTMTGSAIDGGATQVPLNIDTYAMEYKANLAGIKDLLQSKTNLVINSVEYGKEPVLKDFYEQYTATSGNADASKVTEYLTLVEKYSPKPAKITYSNFTAFANTPLSSYSQLIKLKFNAQYYSNFVNTQGLGVEPATGMGLNVKAPWQLCPVIGTYYFVPIVITISYRDKCDLTAASVSTSSGEYWDIVSGNAGIPGSTTYKPTKKMVDVCTCGTATTPADPKFSVFKDDLNGGTTTKASSIQKVSCNTVKPVCDISQVGSYTPARLDECCNETPLKPGFDSDLVCPPNQTFDLYCIPGEKLTATKTYKSIKNEIPEANTACYITCSETGTPMFKSSPTVVAGQSLDYNWTLDSRRVCTAEYKNTATEWVNKYNEAVKQRVAAYNEYVIAKAAYDSWSPKCPVASRNIYYTCPATYSPSSSTTPVTCSKSGTETKSNRTDYSCSSGNWSGGTAPTTPTCSDGATSSPKPDNNTCSGTCNGIPTQNYTCSWTKSVTCPITITTSDEDHCECTDIAGNPQYMTCDAYSTELSARKSTMDAKKAVYDSKLQVENGLMADKNTCDNWAVDYNVNGEFELQVNESLPKSIVYTPSRTVTEPIHKIIDAPLSKTVVNCGATETVFGRCGSIGANVYETWTNAAAYKYSYTYGEKTYIDRGSAVTYGSASGLINPYDGGYRYYTWLGTFTGSNYNLDMVMTSTKFGAYDQWDFTKIADTGEMGVDCSFAVQNNYAPDNDDDNYKKYGNLGFTFRTVNLSDLFPNNRKPGSNWANATDKVNEIQSLGDSVYNKTPKYTIKMTPEAMKKVRSYTAQVGNSYSKWSGFVFYGNTGRSTFLASTGKTLGVDIKIVTGI